MNHKIEESYGVNNIEKKHYHNLRKNFDSLVKLILGDEYYTMCLDVFNSDIEAFNDMVNKVNKLKYHLKMYKRLFYCMTIITLILGIYSVIK